jgi:hypothetical protein
VLWIAALAGCGTAAYEERMQATAKDIQVRQDRATRLKDNLHGGAAIGDAAVEIRVPKVFEASFTPDSPHPADGAKIAPQRAQPPFLNLPNLKLTYEARADGADEKSYPYYCYLAASQGAAGDASKLADELARQLRMALPGGGGWETVECPTPDGDTLSCRRIRATGKQLFDATPADGGRARFVPQEGTFDLYLHEANGWITLVGFRVPAPLAEKFKLDEIGPLSVGTLKSPSA